MIRARVLDEFTAVTGLHRKLAIRLLTQSNDDKERQPSPAGRRVFDKVVREAVIVAWEAADRLCGRRLHAALPHLVESMERHGQLKLDSLIRERLLTASASTLDRQLRPIRSTAGSRRRRGRRNPMRRQVPVRTYKEWNKPPPGYLEIDRVAHCGGPLRRRRTTFSSTGPRGWPRRCWATASPFPGRGAVRSSLEHLGGALDDGWSVLIYPVGRNNYGELDSLGPGAGMVAVESRTTIVPIRVRLN